MQHELMRHPTPPSGADNVGDVLASIRRLIAQDETEQRLSSPAPQINHSDAQTDPLATLSAIGAVPYAQTPPLVLDASTLIGMAHDPAVTPAADQDQIKFGPSENAGNAPRTLGDWMNMTFTAEPNAQPAALSTQAAGAPVNDHTDTSADLFGPLADTHPTTPQQEDPMLQANASVTPINAAIEGQAAAEALGAEPHLFAPQDKASQKGMHMRGMIRDAIRQELQGEVGNRLSRNLQQMIRHEIELTLRTMCENE